MLREVVIEAFLKDQLEGSLDQVIENLQNLKEENSKDFTNLRIRIELYEHGDYEMELLGTREETPKEKEYRIFHENEKLRRERQRELEQLEFLKKKYE